MQQNFAGQTGDIQFSGQRQVESDFGLDSFYDPFEPNFCQRRV